MPTYNDSKADSKGAGTPDMAEYERVKKELKELITKKRGMDKSLVSKAVRLNMNTVLMK